VLLSALRSWENPLVKRYNAVSHKVVISSSGLRKEVPIMDSKMKYYLYVSDAKVDMLYLQIDKSLLKKIAAELSVDLKLLGAGFGATIKQNQSEETRYSKLKLVVKYIEKHLNVGWVDAPATYFKGSLPMGWGLLHGTTRYDPNPQPQAPFAVYFGGSTERTAFGMVGSAHHLIGLRSDAPKSNIHLYYTTNEMLKALSEDRSLPSEELNELGFLIPEANHTLGKPNQYLEFLAKTYLYKNGDQQSYLLGSPIYVAFAD